MSIWLSCFMKNILIVQELIKDMGTGLMVTELIGHGVNTVTGDYSRGAAGFWVENGVMPEPCRGGINDHHPTRLCREERDYVAPTGL